jgi:hypothetical protein
LNPLVAACRRRATLQNVKVTDSRGGPWAWPLACANSQTLTVPPQSGSGPYSINLSTHSLAASHSPRAKPERRSSRSSPAAAANQRGRRPWRCLPRGHNFRPFEDCHRWGRGQETSATHEGSIVRSGPHPRGISLHDEYVGQMSARRCNYGHSRIFQPSKAATRASGKGQLFPYSSTDCGGLGAALLFAAVGRNGHQVGSWSARQSAVAHFAGSRVRISYHQGNHRLP